MILPQANWRLARHFCRARSARPPWPALRDWLGRKMMGFSCGTCSARMQDASGERGIFEKACDGQRLQMSGQRQAQIRHRRRRPGHRQAPGLYRRCPDETPSLPLQLVPRLAFNEKNRKHKARPLNGPGHLKERTHRTLIRNRERLLVTTFIELG